MDYYGLIADGVFVVLCLVAIIVGAHKGFVKGLLKFAGTLFSIIFAVIFCVGFANFLENLFGMTSAIGGKYLEWLSGNEAMNVVVQGENIKDAFTAARIPGFIADWIIGAIGEAELAEGTTLAMLVAPVFAQWTCVAISFVALVIIMKISVLLIGKIFSSIIEKIPGLNALNKILGALLGLFEMAVLLFFVFSLLHWLAIPAVDDYLQTTYIIKHIYFSEWFASAFDYVISFRWYDDYIAGLFAKPEEIPAT